MASLVLGAAGAAVGFMVGGPAGAQIGFALGSAAGGLLFPPKGPDGPRLNDLSVQSSTYGKGIAIPYATNRIAGNIIWADKIQEHAHEEGGKGGPSFTTYSYTDSFAVSICEGPIAGVTRIWADGLLIYDLRPTNTGERVGFKAGAYKLYLGTEDQLPDPTIQALIGDTPAYRGQAYMVFTDLQLAKFGNRIPSLSFEVVHTADAGTLPPPEPFIPSGSNMMARDPLTGYLFVPMSSGGVVVYDPKTRTTVTTIGVSAGQYFTNPYGVIYANGKIIVGNSGPAFYDILGWEIDPVTFIATPIMRVPDPSETDPPPPGGAYFWPGLPSKEGVFFGTGGLYGGASFDSSNGRRGPVMPTPGGNVMVSPDQTTEIFLGQMSGFMGMDLVLDSAGRYHEFRLMLGVPAGETTPADGHKVAWNDPAHTLYYGHTGNVGVYEFQRSDGAMRLVIPDVKPEIILYSPDTDLVYVQDDRSTNFASYRVTTTGYFPKVEDFPGAGVGAMGMHSTAIYLGEEEWAVSGGGELGPVWSLKFANTLAGGPAPLADIVTDISLRAGLTAADIDVSELTDLVDGYCITHQMAARSALEPLMQAYFFDPVESDYKIKFRKRGRPAVVTIPDEDLAAHSSGSEPPDLIEIRRKQELDLPQIVNVKYINPAADYQTSTQYEARQTGRSNSAVTVDLPVVMSDEKAKQVAAAALYTGWAERTGLSFATSLAYAKYEPTDCFIVHGRLVRIVHRKRNGGIIEWEGYADGNTIYPSETVNQGGAAAPSGSVDQVLVTTPLTRVQLMDTPMLANVDGSPGFVVAAQGTNIGWTGAQIFKSIDGGVSFQPLVSVTTASIMGTAVNALAPYTGGDTFDELNSVTISLPTSSPVSTLASATELAVLNGANAALLGDELIQYKRAVLNDDGTVTLSGLLRYRRGTDYATHTAGERFVALGTGAVQVPVSTADIGLPRQYKAATNGGTLADAQAVTLTYTGADLKPYSPVHIGGWRDAAGNLTLNWVRRTRIGGEWRDGVDVPLGEMAEAYDVEIWSAGFTTLKRTFSNLASPTVDYSAAQQADDFGSAQATVYVRVYQLSSVVGRGFPGSGIIASGLGGLIGGGTGGGGAGGGTGGGDTGGGSGGTPTVTYTESTADFPNPERGFVQQHGNSQLVTLSASGVASQRTTNNVTVHWMLVYLNDYINSAIPTSILNNIQANFDAARNGGGKVWLRFSYEQNGSGADATKPRIKGHIDQLKPYLQANGDVIAVMDAGFIGSWGEESASSNFGNEGAFTTQNWTDRKEILEYLLDALPSNRSIMVAVVGYKRYHYASLTSGTAFSGSYASRIGHHQDSFLSGGSEQGYYGLTDSIAGDRAYLAEESKYTPRGGETDNYDTSNLTKTACPAALSDLALHHWSLLNNGYHASVLQQWKDGGCYDDISKKLGYRFVLVSGTYPSTATNGAGMDIAITLNNAGYASPFNQRTAKLVLRNTATNAETTIALSADPRTWLPGPHTISETVAIPSGLAAGTYALFLVLPDSAASLAANPAYAIRFANTGTWEASTGYNDLGHTVTIS